MQVFQHYQELERFIGWTDEDAGRMQLLGPVLSPYFDALIDDFYGESQRRPQTARVITGGQPQIDRLKRTLRDWLAELFSGCYDCDYVARRWDVGKRHVDIGLDQLYTNASLSRLRRGLLAALEEAWPGEDGERLDCRESLNTLLDLNLAIIEHAYHTEYARRQATAERLATIGKVAGSIVEELRGPLEAAKNSITLLREKHDAPQEIQRVHLDHIDRQTTLAEGVVSSLNDFVRLPVESFRVVDIIECLREAFDPDNLPAGAQAEWDLPVTKLLVHADPAQLRIVLGKLIRNAQVAMSKRGLLQLGALPDGDAIYVTIRHSKRCKCAGACQRSEAEPPAAELRNGKLPGAGLGRSILHDIVLRHRGALTITEEGSGSSATLCLPAHR